MSCTSRPLGDDLGDREARRERSVGILEHDLHLAAQWPHVAAVIAVDALALEYDLALAVDQAEECQAERGLAGAGLADHTERFALADLDGHVFQRMHIVHDVTEHAGLDREPDLQVFHRRQRLGIGRRRMGTALGLGGEQHLGIGVFGILEELFRRLGLDDLALLHHRDAVGEMAHDAEIMGDQQDRHAEPRLQLAQ